MRKPKNRKIGHRSWCNCELYAFGTPFVVQERDVIYKDFYCHTTNPKTDCLGQFWMSEKLEA